jgi:hypothetical protein
VGWSDFIALVALFAAIGPRVVDWGIGKLQGGRVRIRTQDTLGIAHHLGRPWLLLHIQIENTGKKRVAIATLDCVVRQMDFGQASPGKPERFPIKVYYADGGGARGESGQLFIGAIHLKPGETWQQVVRPYGPRSENEEEQAQRIGDRFGAYFAKVNDERRADGNTDQSLITVMDAELVTDAQAFARKQFTLDKGRYELYLAALDWDGRILGAAKHSLSISEFNYSLLKDVIENYQYGPAGSPYQRTLIEPRLSPPAEGATVIKEYSQLAL